MTRVAVGPTRRWWRHLAVLAAGLLALSTGCADAPGTGDAGATAALPRGGASAGADAGCAGGDGERRPLEGFGEVTFRVGRPGGTDVVGCALLAESAEARSRGLMDQEDLRGYDAMVFRFDAPSTGGFYMYDTRIPLSIAYVAEDGGLVSSIDMDPCPEEEASDCPTYDAVGPYLHAIEVCLGDLPGIGIEPGATVTFDDRPAS